MILRFSGLAASEHVAQVQRVSAMRMGSRVFPSDTAGWYVSGSATMPSQPRAAE
jgi:hypothetical protein